MEEVERWLSESLHMPVNALRDGPDSGATESPARAPLQFMFEVGSTPRAETFLRLLAAQGADIDDRSLGGNTLLQEAVQYERKDEAILLLDVGAKPGLLDDSQRDKLPKLLAQPNTAPYTRQVDQDRSEGCIESARLNGHSA
ncbi:hypothetical protein LFL97_38975 (plasmid) [Burkholderia sp. JSH-S8]|nr:hypothetical protein LFL97_38975 [Burkholderia sp. JSH-S8]